MSHVALPVPPASGPSVLATLLRKELRLVADGVVPALAILASFLLLGSLVLTLPSDWRHDAFRSLRIADLFAGVAAGVAIGSPILAGWWTAAVLTGDRRHGARSLAEALPASRWKRLAARLVGLVPALAGPGVLSFLLLRIAVLLDPQILRSGVPSVPFSFALGLAAIGIVPVGFAASRMPTLLSAQLAGHVGTLLLGLLAFVAGWLTFLVTGAEILRIAGLRSMSAMADAIRLEGSLVGAAIGALAGLCVIAVAFVAAMLQARSSAWERRVIGCALAAALLAAIVATPIVARRSALLGPSTAFGLLWERRATLAASDEDVARGIRATVAAWAARQPTAPDDDALFQEGVTRLAEATAGRESHPLWAVFLELESATEIHDLSGLWTISWRPSIDLQNVRRMVELIIRFPGDEDVVQSVHGRFGQFGFWPRTDVREAPVQIAGYFAVARDWIGNDRADLAVERLREAWPDLDWSSVDRSDPQ